MTLSVGPTVQGESVHHVKRMGSHCVSAAILVRCLWENAKVDMALTHRSNLISMLVLDGRHG